ncbi:MAG: DUF5069 domain-containing protein [Opitutae bacterium]|nr:DUF5069 domain-containing protein [Opitutae bacterium]
MPHVPGLRSCYAKVGRLVYFGRMLDKIRLHAAGALPADYQPNFGRGFDGLCCRFLRVKHDAVSARVAAGGTDDEILAWGFEQGGARTSEECEIWNNFMMKRGWRDGSSAPLAERIVAFGLAGKTIETLFDLIENDEGRDPAVTKPWLAENP